MSHSTPGGSGLIRFGDKGDGVRLIQRALGTEVDGRFGRRTEKTLLAFQTKNGLRADGIAGPATRSVLQDVPSGSGSLQQDHDDEALD